VFENIVTISWGELVPCHRAGDNFKIDFIRKTMKRFVRCWGFAITIQKITSGVHEYCNNHFWAAVHCQEVGHNFKLVFVSKTM